MKEKLLPNTFSRNALTLIIEVVLWTQSVTRRESNTMHMTCDPVATTRVKCVRMFPSTSMKRWRAKNVSEENSLMTTTQLQYGVRPTSPTNTLLSRHSNNGGIYGVDEQGSLASDLSAELLRPHTLTLGTGSANLHSRHFAHSRGIERQASQCWS